MDKLIRVLALFILVSLTQNSITMAQEPASSRYFDERAKGDEAASSARAAFALSVGNAALSVFCSKMKWKTPTDSYNLVKRERACGSPVTIVANRFISKYGVGLESANQDALPVIKHIFQVLNEIDEHQINDKKGLSPSVQKRITFISKNLNLSTSEVELNLKNFIKQKLQNKLTTIEIDFWGYFQQTYPERAKFSTLEQGESLKIAFRWCSEKKKFVNESNRMVSDVLSAAINNENPDLGMTTAKQYQNACDLI